MRRAGARPRAEALENGDEDYTGQPCAACGSTLRYARSGNCKRCRQTYFTLDEQIALAMWKAADRPCEWQDLDDDEQAEWITMATAARERLLFKINHALRHMNDVDP